MVENLNLFETLIKPTLIQPSIVTGRISISAGVAGKDVRE